jgi:hypothetical protein
MSFHFFIPDYVSPHRAPVLTINTNGTTTKTNLPSPKKQNRNMGAIVVGTIGGVVAIFAVIGIVTFVQRRRRWRRSRPGSIFSTDFVDAGPQILVSPYDANSFDANQDLGFSAEQQPLVIGDPEAEMAVLHHLSSSESPPPSALPLLRQVTPVPAALSDKEIARLRAEALSSPQPHNLRISALNMSQSSSSLNAVTAGGSGESYDTRRLHTEFESLRREVELLREEGLVVAAPPRYTDGDG